MIPESLRRRLIGGMTDRDLEAGIQYVLASQIIGRPANQETILAAEECIVRYFYQQVEQGLILRGPIPNFVVERSDVDPNRIDFRWVYEEETLSEGINFVPLNVLAPGFPMTITSFDYLEDNTSARIYWESNPRLEIKQMTVTIEREMAPIYTMPGDRPQSRIAGTIQFSNQRPQAEFFGPGYGFNIPPTDITYQYRDGSRVAEMKLLNVELLSLTTASTPEDIAFTYIARQGTPWKLIDSYKEEEDTIYA